MRNELRHQNHWSLWRSRPRMHLRPATAALPLAMALVTGMVGTPPTKAQTLTTLHSFDGTDGSTVHAGLVQGTDGNLYGTTQGGGANGAGTVFKLSPIGTLTTLHNFDFTDGFGAYAGLLQATDGNFYGTMSFRGANGGGTVFKITPTGTLTTLYSFCSQSGCTDGQHPFAALVQATDGNFYGTTLNGGEADCFEGCGTVFKIRVGDIEVEI